MTAARCGCCKPVTSGVEDPGCVLVDQVTYDDESPWPIDADGAGASLQRLSAGSFGMVASSWRGRLPSPGAAAYVARETWT